MNLHDIDLNLLLVFDRLLKERSVSLTGQSLGMSQPAVSNALARLRKILDDPLFVRTARGMEPTPYAMHLAEPVAYAMATLLTAINRPNAFHPASSPRSFNVAMTDIGEIYFLPELMRRLHQEAPAVGISTLRNTSVNLQEEMEAGHVDLAVGLLPQLSAGIYQQRLFTQRYVCLHRQQHPWSALREVGIDDFTRAEHLLVKAVATGHDQADEVMARRGIARRIRLTVPHFVAVGQILQSTDLVATVPERLAHRVAQPFGLVVRTHPVDLPEIAINVFWHARLHRDPANQWLRRLFYDGFSQDAGAPAG